MVPAGIDLLAGLGLLRTTQDRAELLAHLPDKVRCLPGRCLDRVQHELFLLRGVELRLGVLAGGQDAAGGHEIEHVVASRVDLGRVGDDDPGLARGAHLVLGDVDLALGHRVAHEVVLGRRLRDGGEGRELGEVEVRERLAEVAHRGGGNPIALVAVEVLVEVGLQDQPLPVLAGVGLGQADRLDDLADLAVIDGALERPRGEQLRAHELLRDRRRTTGLAAERVEAGRDDGADVEARVRPEVLVLDGRRRVDHLGRDLVEVQELAAQDAEACELDRTRAVIDDRGLLELEALEGGRRVGQIAAVERVRADRADEANATKHEEAAEEEERDGERRAAGGATSTSTPGGSVATMPLTPLEGGLHEAATIP